MANAGFLPRLWRLPLRRKLLLLRATPTLAAASVAVAMLPFRRAVRYGAVPLGRRASGDPQEWVWAIEAAAPRLPLRTVCIEQGLALQRLLRRDGHDALLHYGARLSHENGELHAHVWVSLGGQILLGGVPAERFAELTTYPARD